MTEPTIILAKDLTAKGVAIIAVTQWAGALVNDGTPNEVLHSYALPSGALERDGDSLAFEYCGQFVAASQDVSVNLGVSALFSLSGFTVADACGFCIKGRIVRTSATTASASGQLVSTAGAVANVGAFNGLDFTLAQGLEITTQSAAEKLTLNSALIDFRGGQ